MSLGRRAPAWERVIVTGLCVYEVGAMWTNAPTITRLVKQRPWLAGPILGVLSVHFLPEGDEWTLSPEHWAQ